MKNKSSAEVRRFHQTIDFVKQSLDTGSRILDLGTPNDMSYFVASHGYQVDSAHGVDFDLEPTVIARDGYDAVTMFEVLEHLVNPMGVLRAVKAPKLFASIPLDLWFAKAYRNKKDQWDQHFHEFEDWQFDWLLDKSGWKVVRSEQWTSPIKKIGLRPILRKFTPRYYIIEAVRKDG